jgi:hypothetical protein
MDKVKKAKIIIKKLHKQVRSHIEKKTAKSVKHANKLQKIVSLPKTNPFAPYILTSRNLILFSITEH